MKSEDPKQIAARERRDRAQLWLEILCAGIGHALKETDRRYYPETMERILERVNDELSEAIDEAKAANKAYEPYWRRRSPRRVRLVKPKKTEIKNGGDAQ